MEVIEDKKIKILTMAAMIFLFLLFSGPFRIAFVPRILKRERVP